jgi:hypothetical protein
MYIQQFGYLKKGKGGRGHGFIPKYNALPIGLFILDFFWVKK